MNPALLGYAAAVLAALDDGGRRTVADELGALERTTSADPLLRAALTDTSIAAASRRAFLADLLAGKVAAPTARIASFAAFSAHAQDVPTSLVEAAHRARQFASGDPVVEPGLSIGAARRRVGGFATAVLEDTDVASLDGVENALFSWARAVESNPELRAVLTNRDLSAAVRSGVVADLLGGRVSDVTVALATYAVVGGRARDLVGTVDWLVDRVAEERGWRVARVRTARPIDEASRERLAGSLRTLVGRPVELEVAQQDDLLGGVLVEVGDLRVDATTKARLDALREQFAMDRHGVRSFDDNETTQGVS